LSHRPRKRFGQNFLHDYDVIEHILEQIDPQPGQHLVEIGPGQGALTRGLLERAGSLDVVELDRDLIGPLQAQLGGDGDLRIHNADALQFDFAALRGNGEPLRLVGNLPYNISTPLIFHLLDQAYAIRDMHFMLQKEVVKRMSAEPGTKAFGRLSVMVQIACSVESLFDVPPESFDPPPKVDSSVVRLVPLEHPLVDADVMPSFCHFARKTFSQRRKALRNVLKGVLTPDQILELGIDPKCRSEALHLDQVIALHDAATKSTTEQPT
jgi:16S rRNA (adenine1518-N6/adenine1519-N6)-dimethyltransferase